MRRTLAISSLVLLAACDPIVRERAVNPMFRGLEGSATNAEVAPLPGSESLSSDPNLAVPIAIREELESGEIVLHSRSARDLMRHVHATLTNQERDLFTRQVLSERTRQEFVARGFEPALAFDEVARRERDVLALFDKLPMGEHSPNALFRKVERRVYRLEVTGKASEGLSWRGFDMIYEKGNWKLLWFVGR